MKYLRLQENRVKRRPSVVATVKLFSIPTPKKAVKRHTNIPVWL